MKDRQNDVLKTVLLVILDVLAVFASAGLSYIMTVGAAYFNVTLELAIWTACNVICVIAFFALFGMYSVILSNMSIVEALKLGFCVLCVASRRRQTRKRRHDRMFCRIHILFDGFHQIFRSYSVRRQIFRQRNDSYSEESHARRRGFRLRDTA